MNKYEVLGVVGEGAYGVVLKCRNKQTNEIYAIKKFKESEEDENIRKNAHREVKVLRQVKHVNIVDLKEAFRRKGKLYLVFEYVDRNLLELLEEHQSGLDPETIRCVIYQLLRALEFLHSNGIIHRDIKPENLLISKKGILKLCDFGFARAVGHEAQNDLTDYVATRWYRPPELLLNTRNYDKSVDLWAAACIMAELIDGKPLFPGDDDLDQLYLVQRTLGKLTPGQLERLLTHPKFKGKQITTNIEETLQSRYVGKMSNLGIEFMCSLLKMEPRQRPTAEQALRHPYFESLSLPDEIMAPYSGTVQGTIPVGKSDGKLESDRMSREAKERMYRKVVEAADKESSKPNSNGKEFSPPKAGAVIREDTTRNGTSAEKAAHPSKGYPSSVAYPNGPHGTMKNPLSVYQMNENQPSKVNTLYNPQPMVQNMGSNLIPNYSRGEKEHLSTDSRPHKIPVYTLYDQPYHTKQQSPQPGRYGVKPGGEVPISSIMGAKNIQRQSTNADAHYNSFFPTIRPNLPRNSTQSSKHLVLTNTYNPHGFPKKPNPFSQVHHQNSVTPTKEQNPNGVITLAASKPLSQPRAVPAHQPGHGGPFYNSTVYNYNIGPTGYYRKTKG